MKHERIIMIKAGPGPCRRPLFAVLANIFFYAIFTGFFSKMHDCWINHTIVVSIVFIQLHSRLYSRTCASKECNGTFYKNIKKKKPDNVSEESFFSSSPSPRVLLFLLTISTTSALCFVVIIPTKRKVHSCSSDALYCNIIENVDSLELPIHIFSIIFYCFENTCSLYYILRFLARTRLRTIVE